MIPLFLPMSRALSQLTDPALFGVVWRSVLFSALLFAAIHAGMIGAVHHLAAGHGVLAWVLHALGSIAAALLALWLFLPFAAIIGSLYIERIARAVERRFYPELPPPTAAPLLDQVWDSIAVGLRVLGLSVLALLLTIFLPGIGLPIGWAIAAWAIGRGLFVAVAMRRMSRWEAEALYRTLRPAALAQGGVMAAAAYFPLLNLLIPVAGTAAMVHVLDLALTRGGTPIRTHDLDRR
ncbi:MAG: cysteine biosynthesis protein CysZ [Acetobacteraceae bacterium]|nr:cysteine biosynthesis protein CysZ [Acetobacteraceae bacterium]